MCLLVFNTAADGGLAGGLTLMSAIALVDLTFIVLAGLGVGALLERNNVRKAVKLFGSLVLVLFGANMAAEAFGIGLLPNVRLFSAVGGGLFVTGLLLTASNPLTIIFWSGVFAAQIAENGYDRSQLASSVLAAYCPQSRFFRLWQCLARRWGGPPDSVIKILNICVGCLIVYFGVRLFLRRETE